MTAAVTAAVTAPARVRLAAADTCPYDLLASMGSGPVARRTHRRPVTRRGGASVARTDGMVAAALAPGPVGIDVERVRPLPDLEHLVHDHLSSADATAVLEAPDPVLAFHRTWTRLEALLKAEGTGIVDGLDPPPEVRDRWRVVDLPAGPGHRAALAVPDTGPGTADVRGARGSR